MLGEPHKSNNPIERLCLVERHDLVSQSLLFKPLLDTLRDSRLLLQCLHEVFLTFPVMDLTILAIILPRSARLPPLCGAQKKLCHGSCVVWARRPC